MITVQIITEISPTEPVEKPYLTNQPGNTRGDVAVTDGGK